MTLVDETPLDDDSFTDADLYGETDTPSFVWNDDDSDGTVDEADAPDSGQAEDESLASPAEDANTADYFDPTAFEGRLARVKVDGEEIDVPVTDLVLGYQRQADYTRKTQELAAEREQLAWMRQVQDAMQANPQATLNYLAQTYGVSGVAAQPQVERNWWEEDDEPQQPQPNVADQIRREFAPVVEFVHQQQANEHLRSVVDSLSVKYGSDFDAREVVAEAVNRGVFDPNSLEQVFQSMMFERYRAQQAASQQAAQETSQQNAQRLSAAQQAGRVVGSGTSVSATGQVARPPTVTSARDAAILAMQEHGIQF